MKYIVVETERLDCINLHGLKLGLNGKTDKLTPKLLNYVRNPKGRDNHKTGKICLKENPRDNQRLLILDGEHRSFGSYVYNERVSGILYDSIEEIDEPLPRLNFDRSLSFHDTAELGGRGEIRDLMDEFLLQQYVNRLKESRMKNIREVILSLEKFWKRVS